MGVHPRKKLKESAIFLAIFGLTKWPRDRKTPRDWPRFTEREKLRSENAKRPTAPNSQLAYSSRFA